MGGNIRLYLFREPERVDIGSEPDDLIFCLNDSIRIFFQYRFRGRRVLYP